jgi:hypothetical protein
MRGFVENGLRHLWNDFCCLFSLWSTPERSEGVRVFWIVTDNARFYRPTGCVSRLYVPNPATLLSI